MRARSRRLALFVCLAGALAAGSASAAGAFYLGRWTFVSAARAPWADPAHPLDNAEPARLRGKTIMLGPRSIAGPPPYLCRGPHYILREYPADMLFEGALGEMRDRDKSVDPAKIAASLGFHGPRFKTIETGCDFDIHFVDADTAEVGLNDYVYTLKRR